MPPPLAVFPLAAVPGCRLPDGRRYGAPRRSVRGGKSASGGLQGYTGASVFEKPCGTKDSSPCGGERRWGAVLAQTGDGNGGSVGSLPGSNSSSPTSISPASPNGMPDDVKALLLANSGIVINFTNDINCVDGIPGAITVVMHGAPGSDWFNASNVASAVGPWDSSSSIPVYFVSCNGGSAIVSIQG